MDLLTGSLSFASNSYASCGVCCDPAISDACKPPLMSTKNLRIMREFLRVGIRQTFGMRDAHVDLTVFVELLEVVLRRMMTAVHSCPYDVFPTLMSFTFLLDAANFLK